MRPHDETMEYIRRAQAGDKAALDALVSDNIALVKSIAARFGGRGVEWDDLFQLGCMGLVKAIRGFDLSYEVRFSTYAVPMIMGEIRRFLARRWSSEGVARTTRKGAGRVFKAREELEREHGREPADERNWPGAQGWTWPTRWRQWPQFAVCARSASRWARTA